MKKLILLSTIALASVTFANAQTASSANLDAVANANFISGRFDLPLSSTEVMNVNYSLSPKSPKTTAAFMLHTPDARPFTAEVLDERGKVVFKWEPTSKVYLYNASWDLTKLSAGNYFVHIYYAGSKKSIYNFPFTKQ